MNKEQPENQHEQSKPTNDFIVNLLKESSWSRLQNKEPRISVCEERNW
jgi:hypothetical protein